MNKARKVITPALHKVLEDIKNNPMKVYIVEEHGGTYEDSWSKIHSVWNDPVTAEAIKDKLKLDYKVMRNAPAPYSEEDYYSDKLSEAQEEVYLRWQQDKWYAEDIGDPRVTEFIVNNIK